MAEPPPPPTRGVAKAEALVDAGRGAGQTIALAVVGVQVLVLALAVVRSWLFDAQRRRARALEKERALVLGVDRAGADDGLAGGGRALGGDVPGSPEGGARRLGGNPRTSVAWFGLSYFVGRSASRQLQKRFAALFEESLLADSARSVGRSVLFTRDVSRGGRRLSPTPGKGLDGGYLTDTQRRHVAQPLGTMPLLKGCTGVANPGELVAIMGPSGCGKTTLLDLLAGRRNTGSYAGVRAAGGVPYTRDDHAAFPLCRDRTFAEYSLRKLRKSSGYVHQHGAAYFNSLTARENLAYSAVMRLEPPGLLDRVRRGGRPRRVSSRRELEHWHFDEEAVAHVAEEAGSDPPARMGEYTPGADELEPPADRWNRPFDARHGRTMAALDYRLQRVYEVLHDTGLHDRADVVVGGDEDQGGLSGGQKRRLAVAIELIGDPAVLFLDEPTSGLDSASSLTLVTVLSALSRDHQRTVMLSIHQPRVEVFLMIDKMSLLVRGFTVFHGRPADAVADIMDCVHDNQLAMFDANRDGEVTVEELQLALEETNPADVVMDVITEAATNSLVLDWLIEKFDRETRPGLDASIKDALLDGPDAVGLRPQRPSVPAQLWAVAGRFYLGLSAAKACLPILSSAFAGIVFGAMFADRMDGQILAAATNWFIFSASIFAPFVADSVCVSLEVLPYEVSSGVAPLFLYVLQYTMHYTLFAGLSSTVLYTIQYAMMFDAFRWSTYSKSVVVMWTFGMTHASICMLIVVVVSYLLKKPTSMAMWAIGFVETFLQLFAGFFLPYGQAQRAWQVLMLLNPNFWAFSALMQVNLGGFPTTCPPVPPPAPLDLAMALANSSYLMTTAESSLRASVDAAACEARGAQAMLRWYGYDGVDPGTHVLVLLLFFASAFAATVVLFYKPWESDSPACLSGTKGVPLVAMTMPLPGEESSVRIATCYTGVFSSRLAKKARRSFKAIKAVVKMTEGGIQLSNQAATSVERMTAQKAVHANFTSKKSHLVRTYSILKQTGKLERTLSVRSTTSSAPPETPRAP